MAFSGTFDREYHIFKEFGKFDEHGNSVGAIRQVQWVKSGDDPDEEKAKIEIRKLRMTAEGEQISKGYTFSSVDGVHELAEELVANDFGDTKTLLRSIVKRSDFMDAAKTINDDPEDILDENGDMFDMRDLFSASSEEMEDVG